MSPQLFSGWVIMSFNHNQFWTGHFETTISFILRFQVIILNEVQWEANDEEERERNDWGKEVTNRKLKRETKEMESERERRERDTLFWRENRFQEEDSLLWNTSLFLQPPFHGTFFGYSLITNPCCNRNSLSFFYIENTTSQSHFVLERSNPGHGHLPIYEKNRCP